MFVGYGRGAGPEAAQQQVLVPRTSVVRKDQVGIITAVDEAATATSPSESGGTPVLADVTPPG